MKIFLVFCLLLIGFSFSNCNGSKKSNQHKIYLEIKDKDKLSIYLKKYFKLSEDRNLEIWYNTYLNKCTQFYKIENPTKDSIVNLIKSYWLTSDQQKHDISKIESRNMKIGKEVFITMDYSYNIIATSTKRIIPKLKLLLVLDKNDKIISIREFSRGV